MTKSPVAKPAPRHLNHHLALRVQPDEGISMVFRAKEPGPGMALDVVPMDFSYGASFRTRPTEAYEHLLHDAMAGDQTLFLREDAVERSWEIVAPVLYASGRVHQYAAGTWGPRAAGGLIGPGFGERLELGHRVGAPTSRKHRARSVFGDDGG